MKIYDYSALFTVIDDLDAEKAMLINQAETDEKNALIKLEQQLLNSGMLKDWKGLNEVLRKANVRGCPYPEKLPCAARFEDSYRFEYCVNGGSSGYRTDYYCLTVKSTANEVRYYQYSTGYGSEKQIDIFATYGDDPVMRKVRVKTRLIKEFMDNYPKYREIKLKQLYEAIGKKSEEVEKLKED